MIYSIEQTYCWIWLYCNIIEMNKNLSLELALVLMKAGQPKSKQAIKQTKNKIITTVKNNNLIWNGSEKYFDFRTNDEIFVSISFRTNNDNGIQTANQNPNKKSDWTKPAIERIENTCALCRKELIFAESKVCHNFSLLRFFVYLLHSLSLSLCFAVSRIRDRTNMLGSLNGEKWMQLILLHKCDVQLGIYNIHWTLNIEAEHWNIKRIIIIIPSECYCIRKYGLSICGANLLRIYRESSMFHWSLFILWLDQSLFCWRLFFFPCKQRKCINISFI